MEAIYRLYTNHAGLNRLQDASIQEVLLPRNDQSENALVPSRHILVYVIDIDVHYSL